MDYYVVINGQKQGPFDILGLIKKAKNGLITAETLVSTHPDGPFKAAAELEEIKDMVGGQEVIAPVQGAIEGEVAVKRVFSDAVELWTRKVVEYTMMVAIIMVIGIMFSMTVKKIQFIADYSYIADYFTSVLIGSALGIFAYYVLITKRNQEIDKKDLGNIAKNVLPTLTGFAAVLSFSSVVFGISLFVSFVTIIVMTLIVSFTVFVPFLVTDHKLKLGRAILLSVNGFKSVGATASLAVVGIVGLNVFAAALPALMNNDAAFIFIVITLPISVAALAYIYDQVLA